MVKAFARHSLARVARLRDLDLWSATERLYRSCRCSPLSAVRHAEVSGVLSLDDSPGAPSASLLDLAEAVIHTTRTIDLHCLDGRRVPDLVHLWPGEHYRLLAAILRHVQAKSVVEVGTFTGLSALAMLTELPSDGTLVTFDIVSWKRTEGAFLRDSDFADSRLTQVIADPASPAAIATFAPLFQKAELIFIDGPKDGVFEGRLLAHLDTIGLRPGTLLVFDDIRKWNMLATWRRIAQPKLDLTSFGHWTGTGLVEWQ